MERRPAKHVVNRVTEIQEEALDMITPDTNVTQMPYQGFISNFDYYSRMQASCFVLDSAINDMVLKKFTGSNLRNMSDEDAIEAYKALEQAKYDRAKVFLELAKVMSNDTFFRKQQEIEKMKLWGNSVINVTTEDNSKEEEEPKKITELEREKQQQVLRLLQEAVIQKMEQKPLE